MKDQREIKPPAWAQRLLSWYCRPELLEDLQGDLTEYFHRNLKTKTPGKAKLIYALDVFKFFRSYTIRKPKFLNLFIQWIMIGSYIKTSGRSIVRNKLFSAINIIGLAISMSVGLLLIGLLSDMFSYDKFHTNHERIYRVISKKQQGDHVDRNFFASTSLRAGKDIQESIPGIDQVAIFVRGLDTDVKSGETTVPLSGMWANEALFNVFTFPLLQGDPVTALKNPFSVVLTEKSAKKLFGDKDPLGKAIVLNDKEYVVTGLMKDIPKFSHLQFDMLASLSTREITEKENKSELDWGNMWLVYVYMLLPEHADLQTLQTNLTQLSETENKTLKNMKVYLSLQPLTDIALGDQLNNSIGPVMGKSDLWMYGALSLVVILSACFNYTNLSIARALRRSREVGIRKVIGALKSHVVGQFVMEAVMISLLALCFSFILFLLLKPYFLSIAPKLEKLLLLDLSPKVIGYFILMALGIGIAAGFFPALFFSRINAIQVLKNATPVRALRNVTLRKTLIVAQYAISLAFIAATIIGFKQYKYFLAFDLGFATENILNIKLQGNKPDGLIKELTEMPEVKGVSKSVMITSVGNYWSTTVKYINPQDSADVYFNTVDENYLPLHGHKLLSGRNFTFKAEGAKESEVIVNQKVLKRFAIAGQDPLKSLGEILTMDGEKVQIIGVMKDFYYGKPIDNETTEVMLRYGSSKPNYINVKVISSDWQSTLSRIDAAWKKTDHVHPLDAQFYDDQIQRAYGEFSAMIKVIGFLAFLAICIACIGLLGMVVFTTEIRLKEISIRKVMGASEGSLIILLSKGFLLLLIIAALIALPSTYLFFENIAFAEFANHAPIGLRELLPGLAGVMTIAFVLIGSQTLKVARTNPTEVLKNE